MDEKIAIIDLGSNSVRIIIMQINLNSSYKMIDQAKEMVRLSEDMWDDNLLKGDAMDRTIATLKQFQNIIKSNNVEKVIAIATAPVRNAVNGNEFLERIQTETGFKFDAISGEKEAYLDYLGVINTIKINDCLIIDTGGGSTELVLVKNRELQNSISIPYGAVTLTEEFLDDETSKSSLNNVQNFVKSELEFIPWLKSAKELPVVGLGGSIRTLAKIHKRRYGFVRQSIHNYHIDVYEVNSIFKFITSLKSSERKDVPGLNKERTDIIIGGLVPVKVILDYLGTDKLIVSGNGLREGAFFENYFDRYKINNKIVDNVLQHSVDNILLKYDVDMQHSHLIKKISLSLFDQLKSIHEISKDYRVLLEVSSLLHDIGLHVDYYDHHYHGFYLALNSRINGLTYRELLICSFIIGMHRNEDFKQPCEDFRPILSEADDAIIEKLSLLVKMSEELCKTHIGEISGLNCKITKSYVKIKTISESNFKPPTTTLQCEKIFKKMFNRNLIVNFENN